MDWQEVCDDPQLRNLPFKIELNRWGKIVMSPAKNNHSVLQWRIQRWIYDLLGKNGEVIPACSIRTSDNVKVADVAWISAERFRQVKDEIAYSVAPEVCVEVISASNSREEMDKKKALYFEAGAREVWFCGEDGALSFHGPNGVLEGSGVVSGMPGRVEI